jgi:hypothetical protein
MLDADVYTSLSEIGDAEHISKSYVSRVLRLALLAPDIVDRILDRGPAAGLEPFLEPLPAEWERQQEALQVTRPHEDYQTFGS